MTRIHERPWFFFVAGLLLPPALAVMGIAKETRLLRKGPGRNKLLPWRMLVLAGLFFAGVQCILWMAMNRYETFAGQYSEYVVEWQPEQLPAGVPAKAIVTGLKGVAFIDNGVVANKLNTYLHGPVLKWSVITILFYIFYSCLFNLSGKEVLPASNARLIRLAGFFLAGYELFLFAEGILANKLVVGELGHELRHLRAETAIDGRYLFFGIALIVLAQVYKTGVQLKEENELTI